MPPTLATRVTTNYEESYSDRGTGSKEDVSVWRPKLLDHESRISYTCTNSRGAPSYDSVVVHEDGNSDGSALAPPENFECVWTDKGTGGDHDGSLWRPNPPPDYVALSDVAIHRSNKGIAPGTCLHPNEIDPRFRCVHVSLVADTELGNRVWCDKGSGGKYDGACWSVIGFPGMRVSKGRHDIPPNHQHKLAAFTGCLFKDFELVCTFINNKDVADPQQKYELTRGMTVQESSSHTNHHTIAEEIAVKYCSGVKDVCSTEVALKFSHQHGWSTTMSKADTSLEQSKTTVTMDVPPKMKVELYQMIMTDSAKGFGAGNINIKSAHWEILNVPL